MPYAPFPQGFADAPSDGTRNPTPEHGGRSMLREFSGAAACGATLAATLSLATPALALTPSTYTPSATAQITGLSLIARADPVPGAPDPNAPRAWSFWSSDGTAWLTGDQNSPVPDGSILG